MAKVYAQVTGGQTKEIEGMGKVGDVRAHLQLGSNYSASVNGCPAADDTPLTDFKVVTFAPAVKGA